jgi:hypothetical protein
VRTFLARSVASRGRRSTAGRRTSARPNVGGPKRPTNAESRTLRPLTPNSGPIFWDWRYLGAVVESALRSRRLTSKELGHVIMCAYGAPRAGIFNGRVLRDIPSRGQCLTCCVTAGRSAIGTVETTGHQPMSALMVKIRVQCGISSMVVERAATSRLRVMVLVGEAACTSRR